MTESTATTSTICLIVLVAGSRPWVKIQYDIISHIPILVTYCLFDQLNHQFGEDWARLTRDLLFDSEGSLKFKPNLWNDIRKVILPQLIEQVSFFYS